MAALARNGPGSALGELVLYLAIMLSGECGKVGNGCERAVMSVAANRVAVSPWPDDIKTVVRRGFFGRRNPPTEEALAVAEAYVLDPTSFRDGLYYFVYSDSDRRRQGWQAGDERLCGGGFCLHLSREWPG